MVKAWYCLMVIGTLIMSACATTTISSSWKDPAYQGTAQKTIVMMVSQKATIRNFLEDQFVAALRAHGNDAVPSYSLVPIEQLNNAEAVASRLRSTGADTVLVSRLVDRKTAVIYVPPSYYGTWGSYYGRAVASPGYAFESQFFFIETNLYNLNNDALIWSGISETEMIESDQQLMKTFVSVMINRLAADKVIR